MRFADLNVPNLAGDYIRLERLSDEHREHVKAVFASDREAWNLMVNNGHGKYFRSWWETRTARMAAEEELTFAVRRKSDHRIVGTTGYYSIVPEYRRVEIGSTFYLPEARGTAINPEAKQLLLDHAFRASAVRIEFVTDATNERSRAALAKLGAKEEGILRKHKITWTGRIRDTAIFSIVETEWPQVRLILERRIADCPNAPHDK